MVYGDFAFRTFKVELLLRKIYKIVLNIKLSSTEKYSRRFSSTHIVLVIYTSFHTVCMITWGTGIDRAKPAGWKPQPDQDYLKIP